MAETIYPARRPLGTATFQDGTSVAPFQYLLSGTEGLLVSLFATRDNTTVRIGVRVLKSDGSIQANTYEHTCQTGGSGNIGFFPLGDGALLSVTCAVLSGVGRVYGETYATIELARGNINAYVVLGTLVQNYVGHFLPIAWPGSPLRSSLDGPPLGSAFNIVAPAAGVAPQTLIPPFSDSRWRVRVVVVIFTTAGGGGNRIVRLVHTISGASQSAFFPSQLTQAGGLSYRYMFCAGQPAMDLIAVGSTVHVPIAPGLQIGNNGGSMTLACAGLQAGDQFSETTVYGDKWIEPL